MKNHAFFRIVFFTALLSCAAIFLQKDHDSSTRAQVNSYHYDVLPGLQYIDPSSNMPVNIKFSCRWHDVCLPQGRMIGEKIDGNGLDMVLDNVAFGQAHPVYASVRVVEKSIPLKARFISKGSGCIGVIMEIVISADNIYQPHLDAVVDHVVYTHVVPQNLPSDLVPLSAINAPKKMRIGIVVTNLNQETCVFWKGAHLHQEVLNGQGKPYRNLGIPQAVVGRNAQTGEIQVDPDDQPRPCVSPSMWLWKIASQAPTVTATKAPSPTCPSKLILDAVPGNGSGGAVTTDPMDGPYVHNEDVILTANPNPGYAFLGWSGRPSGVDSTPSLTVTMDQDRSLTAHFASRTNTFAPLYDLRLLTQTTPTGQTGGEVKGVGQGTLGLLTTPGNPGTYASGEQVALTATPKSGYIFAGWSGSNCDDAQATCTITMNEHRTVTASFAPPTTLTTGTRIEDASRAGGGGSITPASGDHVYPQGKAVNLIARAAPTHIFSRWKVVGGAGACDRGSVDTGQGRVSATCTVTLTADTTVTAYFWGPKGLTVTASASGDITCKVGEGTAANCEGATTNYDHGTTVTLMATPDNTDTHEFSHWTVSTSGGVSGSADTRHTKNPLDVTLDADTTVTAVFTAKATPTPTPTPEPTPQCTLTVRAGIGGKVKVGATTTAASSASWMGDCGTKLSGTTGANAMPSATANSGYSFTGWSSSPSGWTGGCSGTGTCTPTVGSATGTAGTYTLTASFASRVVVPPPDPDPPPPDPDPPPPPTGGTHSTSSSTVTRWGWTANCRRGGGSGNDNGTKYALQSTAAAVARVWINRNCPRAGGTYEIIDTRTYYWSATCRIGAGSHRRSGYTSWSAAVAAGRAWISADCPKGGGTSSTNSTTQWYADVICVHGDDFTVGPYDTETEARTIGEFTARTLCPQASVSGDAPTPTAQASDDDVGGEEGHSAYSVRSATAYGWTARCTNGGGRGSGSGHETRSAAASAGRAWVAANCEGGGRLTTGSNTTHGWEGSCHAGGGTGSGSGHETRSAAGIEAGAWINANCAGGGTFDTPSTSTTTWSWSASCNSGSRNSSGSGLASQAAATSAAQAWITANCGG